MSGFTQDRYWWEESWCVTPDPHNHPHFPNILDQLCLQKGIKLLGATFELITLILPESDISNSSVPKSRPLRLGFPGGSDGKDSAWRRERLPTPVFLPGEFQAQRSLVGYSPWKSQRVRHKWVTFTSIQTFEITLGRPISSRITLEFFPISPSSKMTRNCWTWQWCWWAA